MSEERLVFPPSMDGLFRGLRDRLTPSVKRELASRGLDVDHLPPAMPVETWRPHLRSLGALAFPELSADEGMRMVGVSFMRGWHGTAIGQATSVVLALLGPARTLTRLDRAFRTADNFTEAKTELLNDHEALVTINEVHELPSYWQGVLQSGLELVLKRQGVVTLRAYLQPGAIYHIKWT